jgi:hypothetical protein
MDDVSAYCSGGCDIKSDFYDSRRSIPEIEVINLAFHYSGFIEGDEKAASKASSLLSVVITEERALEVARIMRKCWMMKNDSGFCPFTLLEAELVVIDQKK